LRAEGDANSELVGTLAGGVRHHAVQTYRGQQQRQTGEEFEQEKVQSTGRDGSFPVVFGRGTVLRRPGHVIDNNASNLVGALGFMAVALGRRHHR
jgi:hypothetical protein